MSNPTITMKRGLHPTEFKAHGSSDYLFNSKGEMNASSVKEVIAGQQAFLNALASGDVLPSNSFTKKEKRKEFASQLAQANHVLVAALNSNDVQGIKTVAANMTAMVYEFAQRDGFMRKFLGEYKVDQGQFPMLSQDTRTIQGYTFDSAGANVIATPVRDKKFFPQEFTITLRVFIDLVEYYQSNVNFFENKLNEMKEQAMVQEDKRWKALADSTIGSINGGHDLQVFSGALTASVIGQMRSALDDANVPAQTFLISANLTKDFMGALGQSVDIFHQYEYVETGKLAQIAGMEVITEATRTTTQKVLQPGEMYVISAPEYHGKYSDREGLMVQEYMPNMTDNGKNGKGWTCAEILSMAITNPRSVIKGKIS